MKKAILLVGIASLAVYGCGDDESAATSTIASSTTSGSGGAGGQGGSPSEVTFTTYIGAEQTNLLFVAAQDGDGAWQPLDGAQGVYHFTPLTGRFGIAYVCDDPILMLTAVSI